MKELSAVHVYFRRYRGRLLLGILFIIISNYFGILAPQMRDGAEGRFGSAIPVSRPSRIQIVQEKEMAEGMGFEPTIGLDIL